MIAETTHDDPDVRLMLRAQNGETNAYRELVDRYWGRIVGRFVRQFGDVQEAEDLAQNVFMRLHRSRHRYRPTARFSTWVWENPDRSERLACRYNELFSSTVLPRKIEASCAR